jgi:hypothetical protein
MVLPILLWQVVLVMARTGLVEDAAELFGALESGTVAEVQVIESNTDSATAVRRQLGDEAFAIARAAAPPARIEN